MALPLIGVRFRDWRSPPGRAGQDQAYQKDVTIGWAVWTASGSSGAALLGDGGGGGSGDGLLPHIAGSIDRDQWRNLPPLRQAQDDRPRLQAFASRSRRGRPMRDVDGKVPITTMRLVHEHIRPATFHPRRCWPRRWRRDGGGSGGGGKSCTFGQRRLPSSSRPIWSTGASEGWTWRELNARRSKTLQAVAPYVFTSTLGLETESLQSRGLCKDMHFTCVTTPHVYVDHQVVEEAGSLAYYFDVAEGIFAAEVVTGLVETYRALLEKLCESGANWGHPVMALLPEASAVAPYRATAPIDDRLLQDPLAEKAAAAKDSLAVVEGATRPSYGRAREPGDGGG